MAAQRRRGGGTAGDMLRSLAVLVPIILLLWLWVRQPDETDALNIAYRPVATEAATATDYPVLVPSSVPQGWRCNSAAYTPAGGAAPAATSGAVPAPSGVTGDWRVGFVTPEQQFAGVEESDGPAQDFISTATKEGDPAGTVVLGGTTWQRRTVGTERSLVRTAQLAGGTPVSGSATTVVTGTATWAQLQTLAGSLQAVRASS